MRGLYYTLFHVHCRTDVTMKHSNILSDLFDGKYSQASAFLLSQFSDMR